MFARDSFAIIFGKKNSMFFRTKMSKDKGEFCKQIFWLFLSDKKSILSKEDKILV